MEKKAIIALAIGQVAILGIRQSETPSKVIVQFGEGMVNPEQGINVLAELNSSDDRFKPSVSVRRTWVAIEKSEAKKLSGITDEILNNVTAEETDLMILNPVMTAKDGSKHELCIEILDSLTAPDKYAEENPEKRAKQFTGKDGQSRYFVKDGNLIFQTTRLATKDARKHRIINSDARVTWAEYQSLQEVTVQKGFALTK
jgi:hypothetical protein